MRGSLVALAGLVVAQDGGCDGGGGSGHRRLAGAGCSGRESGLRAMLTRQKGSAGRGCPHLVLERAGRDAEGGRRRGRAETAGRRWWRGRKRAVPASWTHGLTPEGAAEADMGSGGPERHRRRAIARRRPHLRRRSSARWGRAGFGSGCAGRGSARRREGSRGQIKGKAVILGAGEPR